MKHGPWLWTALALGSAACGQHDESLTLGESTGDDVATLSQAIVRGEVEEGRPQVMALLVYRDDGGEALCSGTLFAPRAVLTAGHCLDHAAGVLVYWGNDFDADFAQLFDPSVAPENWRFAEEWRQHPRFDLASLDSDVAVVHVDRDLPFEPLPLSLARLSDHRVGERVEILGYGAEESDETNASGPGAYLERSGYSIFEGTPRRWPLPPNPHPGLTDPQIRKQLMQIEGDPPFSNACFGDSGGPALMRVHGREQVVGVFSWTGDFCQDFSYYVRLDRVASFVRHEARYARHRE